MPVTSLFRALHQVAALFGDGRYNARGLEPYVPDLSGTTVLVFVVVFVLTYVGLRPFLLRRRDGCRWARVPRANRPPFTKWRCKDCLTEAYSSDCRPPKECKRNVKSII